MSNQEWKPPRYTVSDACPGCGCIVYGHHYCPGKRLAPGWVCDLCKALVPNGTYHDCKNGTMPTETTPTPAPQPSLRKAACEALLAGGLLLSDAQRDSPTWGQSSMAKHSEERFRKALEQLAEALAQ